MAQRIMNHVNNETLINFKEAGRNNAEFLGKERFYWLRIIRRYNCLIGELQEVWKKVVRKTPVEIIKELAIAVHQFPERMFRERKVRILKRLAVPISSLDFVLKVEKQWHPLFIGAACGSVDLCNHIIQKVGVKYPMLSKRSARCRGKLTPLVAAADLNEDLNVFKFLLEKAEDKNPILTTDTNSTLLHDLVRKGQMDKCRLMIKEVVDKSPRDDLGSTPYHIAAGFGHVELCRLLVEYHIDKNPRDREGNTPLYVAAIQGHLEVCKLLMEMCLDQNHLDDGVRIPLHIAALNGHVEVVGLFMANVSDKNIRVSEAIQGSLAQKTQNTPLHSAITGGNLNVCKLLIEEYKVDVNASDNDGMTPLHLASEMGDLEICKFLCKYVQNINTGDNDGKTPLDLAILEKEWGICKFLLEICVDKNHVDDSVREPLHIAAINGHVEVVALFMANVSDKNLRSNISQNTPLLSAIIGGNLNLCKLLIEEYKVDVNAPDLDGMTPLHLASKMGYLEICKFLCKYVQNKNTKDNDGRTPIDLAILEENYDIVFCMELF